VAQGLGREAAAVGSKLPRRADGDAVVQTSIYRRMTPDQRTRAAAVIAILRGLA
jgi:hypothetical protein